MSDESSSSNVKIIDIEKMKDTDLLTDEQVAHLLTIKPRTVGELRRKRKIGCHRVTARISRISVRHLKDYLTKIEQKPISKYRK